MAPVGPEVILFCCVTILSPLQKKFNMGIFPSWASSSSLVQETLRTLVILWLSKRRDFWFCESHESAFITWFLSGTCSVRWREVFQVGKFRKVVLSHPASQRFTTACKGSGNSCSEEMSFVDNLSVRESSSEEEIVRLWITWWKEFEMREELLFWTEEICTCLRNSEGHWSENSALKWGSGGGEGGRAWLGRAYWPL